ncbi:hypothetical protein [Cryptosporidium parvum Iowa II]|uniref:Uncharacterized protein n=2 Tax=Cryptosporidium parvum TaxID=5807 RepID=Q5CQ69_CRYPI|nr:hypothetical protein [Cryptosporidium parvum Iowa II]EAK87543.1 hypothetical protein cgd5_3930 [Cryptosporidium parvum Iowa II]QOY41800.1 Uncharacterized protein CPATCC_0025500 [Cryptosporidium parvum]WKS78022.1 hypothetical protein CPCDC_5g3930 [Cryptosporidium sp. 43IA8]WRK32512.1 Uncharacterized protein cpbgf_5003930 [Cryptosporidium parvum]|eukprot:QOY41800.1 hypothetical protein CPATCC_002401 [Cryptosporidium parvum]
MKIKSFVAILVIKGLLLTTRVNSCGIHDLDINDENSNCKNSYFEITEEISLNSLDSLKLNELIFDSIELIINQIKWRFEKDHERYLSESQKSLSFVNNISLDERIDNYIKNANFLTGEEIKKGVLQILKNYQKNDKLNNFDSSNRIIHSEVIENNKIPLNQGFINLVVFPNEYI